MLLFMLSVMVHDFIILVASIIQETNKAFSHDTSIYPDHQP